MRSNIRIPLDQLCGCNECCDIVVLRGVATCPRGHSNPVSFDPAETHPVIGGSKIAFCNDCWKAYLLANPLNRSYVYRVKTSIISQTIVGLWAEIYPEDDDDDHLEDDDDDDDDDDD
jgi:hypothetical protein